MEPGPPHYPKAAQVAIIVGLCLIVFGLYRVFTLFSRSPWWAAVASVTGTAFSFLWPVVLIGAGAFLVWAARRGKFKGIVLDFSRPLRRSATDKRFTGLCGGIAQYLSIDSTIVRVLFVVFLLLAPVLTVIVYIVVSLIVSR